MRQDIHLLAKFPWRIYYVIAESINFHLGDVG